MANKNKNQKPAQKNGKPAQKNGTPAPKNGKPAQNAKPTPTPEAEEPESEEVEIDEDGEEGETTEQTVDPETGKIITVTRKHANPRGKMIEEIAKVQNKVGKLSARLAHYGEKCPEDNAHKENLKVAAQWGTTMLDGMKAVMEVFQGLPEKFKLPKGSGPGAVAMVFEVGQVLKIKNRFKAVYEDLFEDAGDDRTLTVKKISDKSLTCVINGSGARCAIPKGSVIDAATEEKTRGGAAETEESEESESEEAGAEATAE